MNILVVSPHPDDETLGAGGTILKQKKLGNKLFWLNVTSVDDRWTLDFVRHRREQINRVIDYYGFEDFFNLGFPATKLASLDEDNIIKSIREVFEIVKPESIIIPGDYDAHSDHRVVNRCCMACAKSFRAPYIKRIMTMEIISETDNGCSVQQFTPNFYVDITDEMQAKLEAVKIYDTEIQERPFPRSLDCIKSLAILRGAASNSEYAEAFHLVKQIE